MDDRGNIYLVDKLKNEALNVETKKVKALDTIKLAKELSQDQYNSLIGMNRAERRKWLKENK